MATSTVNLTAEQKEAAAIEYLNAEARAFASDPFLDKFVKDSAFMDAVAQKTEELRMPCNRESWKTIVGILFAEGRIFLKDPAELVRLRDEKAKQDLEAVRLRMELLEKQEAEAKAKLDKKRRIQYEIKDREAGSLSGNRVDVKAANKKVLDRAAQALRETESQKRQREQSVKDNEAVYYPDGHKYAGTINYAATEAKRARIEARNNANVNTPRIPSVQDFKSGAAQFDAAFMKSLSLDQAKMYSRNNQTAEYELKQEAQAEVARQRAEKFSK